MSAEQPTIATTPDGRPACEDLVGVRRSGKLAAWYVDAFEGSYYCDGHLPACLREGAQSVDSVADRPP
jgi:hypothetical protein